MKVRAINHRVNAVSDSTIPVMRGSISSSTTIHLATSPEYIQRQQYDVKVVIYIMSDVSSLVSYNIRRLVTSFTSSVRSVSVSSFCVVLDLSLFLSLWQSLANEYDYDDRSQYRCT